MKKIFTSLILLVAGVLFSQLHAADLTIAGTAVTTSNASNIKPTGLTSGTIKYDFDNKTLTLDNVTFNSTSTTPFIKNEGVIDLNILVKGTCNITNGGAGIDVSQNTKIRGYYCCDKLTLTATTGSYTGLYLRNSATVKVNWLDLNIYASWPVTGDGKGTLSLACVKFYAKTNNSSYTKAISSLKSLTLLDMIYENGSYKFSNGNVVDGSGNVPSTVSIIPTLRVGAYNVNVSASENDIIPRSAAGVTAGSVTWDRSTKTIKFDGATQKLTGEHSVCNNGVDDLNISYAGSNTVTTTVDIIKSRKNLTLSGNGNTSDAVSMTSTGSSDNWGIWMTDSNLTIKNLNLTMSTNSYGIRSQGSKSALNISNSNVYIYTTNGQAVRNFVKCDLTGCDVNNNGNVCYRTALKGFGTPDALISNVYIKKISTYYPVYIFGHHLNNVNYSAFEELTSGTISYDATNKVLTLNGATLENVANNTNAAIKLTDVNITLTGTNTITSKGSCIWPQGTVEINGTGNMTAKSTENSGISVFGTNSKISLKTSNYFMVNAARYGYYGNSDDILTLQKNTADLYGYGFQGNEGAMYNIGTLTLDNMDYSLGYTTDRSDFYFEDKKVKQTGGSIVKDSRGVGFSSIKEKLNLYVGGKQLNRVNSVNNKIYVGSPNITSANGSSPAIYYEPSTKTLTLDNATLKDNNMSMPAISSYLAELNIQIKGTNNIETNYRGIQIKANNGNTTIKGGKTDVLNIKTPYDVSFYILADNNNKNNTLTLDGAQISLENSSYGLCGKDGTFGETLIMNNGAAVKASGSSMAVGDLASIQLYDGIKISKPEGASLSTYNSGKAVMKDGACVKSVVLSNGNSIFDYQLGDVNKDGSVTMSDANAVVNYYLSTNKSSMAGFDVDLANVNGDDDITMSDANAIVNMYLAGQ